MNKTIPDKPYNSERVITTKVRVKGCKKLRKKLKKIKKQTKQLNRALKKSAELRKKLF